MGIKIQHVCDHCGKSQDTHHQMWWVAIFHRSQDTYGCYMAGRSEQSDAGAPQQYWCRACMESFGLLPWKQSGPPPAMPTFEDMVREIAREEIEVSK